jgi:hypothetical protein
MTVTAKKILLAFCFCLFSLASAAAKGPVALNVDIPPDTRKAVRLRNLPRDAVVDVAVVSSGEILVAIVDSAGYQKYPKGSRPLFLGQVEDRLGFSIKIPATDHYYLVLQNRSTARSQSATIMIRAAREETVQLEAADKVLQKFEQQLHQLFIFDSFPIQVMRCDKPQIFGSTPEIVLCAESAQNLYRILGDKALARDTLGFAIFHIVADKLLSQWLPILTLAEKETKADQFATVFSSMLNKKDQIESVAAYLLKNPQISAAMIKFFENDRHLLTVPRAKSVLGWLDDTDLILKWQKVLVPRMQTSLLQRLRQRPTAWTDISLVEKELARRR